VIAEVVRRHRLKLRLSESELAETLGWVTDVPIKLFEMGDYSSIRQDKLVEVARALGLDPRSFCMEFLQETSPVFYAAIFTTRNGSI
jgi:hypothetical protein